MGSRNEGGGGEHGQEKARGLAGEAKRLTKEGEHPLEIGSNSGGRPVEGEAGETTRAVLL